MSRLLPNGGKPGDALSVGGVGPDLRTWYESESGDSDGRVTDVAPSVHHSLPTNIHNSIHTEYVKQSQMNHHIIKTNLVQN